MPNHENSGEYPFIKINGVYRIGRIKEKSCKPDFDLSFSVTRKILLILMFGFLGLSSDLRSIAQKNPLNYPYYPRPGRSLLSEIETSYNASSISEIPLSTASTICSICGFWMIRGGEKEITSPGKGRRITP